ncbi:hypothetical protein SAV14893_080360 [Streptomyces avermitilis]|uniref:Insertion element IS402-like domain-containing protein n=1 Tax=Streptomyces avermitilis TaxID=33903 RepID=A0A4D4MH17_STRAX|nr:hypothetical protein SAV14893_080360 [Streptomyces avermitilis]GDY70984.1 hypothetical protein SAV31267_004690 [Streptomyces avermitilis]
MAVGVDHREVIDAIAFKFRTGTQWVHLHGKYGNWRGVYKRLRMWAVDGTWEGVFTALMAQAAADKDLDLAVSVDSTIARAHQHAAGARKRGPRPTNPTTMPSDGPAADRPRRSTWLPMPAAGLWLSSSPPDSQAMHRPSPMSWPACAFPADVVGRAPDRVWSWRTRRIGPARSASICGDAASMP